MELSTQAFLDSVTNPNTKKGYRYGLQKFCDWFGKSGEEILEMRKDDLTQKAGENLIEYKNRAARFEKKIEKFQGYLLAQGYYSVKVSLLPLPKSSLLETFQYHSMVESTR